VCCCVLLACVAVVERNVLFSAVGMCGCYGEKCAVECCWHVRLLWREMCCLVLLACVAFMERNVLFSAVSMCGCCGEKCAVQCCWHVWLLWREMCCLVLLACAAVADRLPAAVRGAATACPLKLRYFLPDCTVSHLLILWCAKSTQLKSRISQICLRIVYIS
jgi:hypothetical protein